MGRFVCGCVVVCLLLVVTTYGAWHASQIMLNRLYRLQTDKHFAVARDYLRAETERLDELQK